MSDSPWKNYFDQKAMKHGASVKSSDYFDDDSFFSQREHILRWLGPQKNKEILDAGCGVGAFSEPWVGTNNVHGVDFSRRSLEFAASRGLKTQMGDLATLPFGTGSFDLVVCIGVIQLIEDYQTVIAELARVTKPGGVLLVQTLHRKSLQRKLLHFFEHSKKFDKMFDMDEVAKVFDQLGLKDISFLKQYHPLKKVRQSTAVGHMMDNFCTSFAIRGMKCDG